MKLTRVFIVVFSVLWSGFVVVATVQAQPPPITLSVTPNAVMLAPGEHMQALVTARISATTVQTITLTAFTDAAINVEIDRPERTGAPMLGDEAWNVSLTRAMAGRPTGTIYFRADYQTQESQGRIVSSVITTSVDIQERVPATIDTVITASLKTSIETLQDQQSRQIFVVVKNISTVPITVTRITSQTLPLITATIEDIGEGYRLEPQQSNPFSMTLTAGNAVQPGKHLLVVRVDAEWEKAGQRTTGSLVLDKDFTVGVFGESAILQATAIPSVMLLPGFLLVTTLILLIKASWKTELLQLDLKKPEFWFFSRPAKPA
jgi:hypothetical protein